MFDFLVDHAIKNVWCTPNQDMQSIIKPARLTPYGGAWNTVQVLWRTHQLPVQGKRFHVYQIGQLHPLLMGLFPSNAWVTLADACNQGKMIVDIYANSGIQMPRCQCWYMVTPDKNLIIAVMEQPRTAIDFNQDDLFVRVYSNAYFNSVRSDPLNDYVQVKGGYMMTTDDVLALQQEYTHYKTLPGETYAFVNGMRVSGIDLFTTHVEDVAEFVYDSSIFKVVDFPIKDLPTFNSELDKKYKYFLHYAGSSDYSIDFHDDIDFFLLMPEVNNRFKGVYYHRNQADAVRNVTHKDYSVPVQAIVGFADSQSNWTDPEALTLRLHIRNSGYLRPLVDEANRIKELYKLPDALFSAAVIGLDATVENWTATNLENSMYAQLMRAEIPQITRQMVETTYGYNAISKLIANTPAPVEVIEGIRGVRVPHGLYRDAIAYEYDDAGVLQGWYSHKVGTVYQTYSVDATFVEMVAGQDGLLLDEVYGDRVVPLDPTAEYRMYICPKLGGQATNEWADVTATGMYARIGNELTWLVDQDHYYTLVRSNKRVLAYDLRLPASGGIVHFSLDQDQIHNGVQSRYVMQIPMGELDLWLNGRSLIEGLDYYVNFPEITIVNKRYLKNPLTDLQLITIRFSGFCKADLTRDVMQDVGFVEYGVLSHNSRFDIRDDKVLRIVVGGKTQRRDNLEFSEEHAGVTVPNELNGSPYMIRDLVVPMRGLAVSDTYALRAQSQVVDKRISDYMTVKVPMPTFDTPNVINGLYEVYSPFLSKIIYDLISGALSDPRIKQLYNDDDVIDICKPYEYLLKFDPTQDGLTPDLRYVVVHPHNLFSVLDVDVYQYKFILRVTKLYLKDAVDISHFIRLSA